MFFSTLLLDTPAAADQQPMGGMSGLLMIVVIIAIFYFFMIRPQQKRQKELRKQREALGKGDTIVTAGGIYGRIVDVYPDKKQFMVEIDKNVKIRIDSNSVYPSVEQANEAAAQNQDIKK